MRSPRAVAKAGYHSVEEAASATGTWRTLDSVATSVMKPPPGYRRRPSPLDHCTGRRTSPLQSELIIVDGSFLDRSPLDTSVRK